MLDHGHPLAKLLKSDRRYKLEAYLFVFEALAYAQTVLGYGGEGSSAEFTEDDFDDSKLQGHPFDDSQVDDSELEGSGLDDEDFDQPATERHLTGQQLCEAIRIYALDQYGYMAKTVLNSWGVSKTGDFGEIVFNLIEIEQMRKTPEDRREDFDDIFDFDTGLTGSFKITKA